MKKVLLIIALMTFVLISAVGCGSEDPLTIWVGAESEEFYTNKMTEYITEYNATHEEEFPYEVSVLGVDTGTAASTYLDDTEAGADIFTVAHDNLGKLITGSSSIAPITNQALLDQIEEMNSDNFLEVIKGSVDGVEYTFGIPYVAQSLVLYYNTDYITEEQVQSWEGILEAATAAEKQALSLTGTDGFNNSFLLLATDAETHYTSLELYADGVLENCFITGDDTVAKFKWGQSFFTDPYGAKEPTDSGWEVELKDEISISVIGGAWHYSAAQAALGNKLGIATLPTFTLSEDDAYGSAVAGTTYKSGTFADAKMFVMKKNSEKADYLEEILLFLSSVDVQEESFEEVNNLPAYKNALEEYEAFEEDSLDIELASAQLEMFSWGIPQPFGASNKFNFYFYSKGAPDLLLDILTNDENAFSTDEEILAQLAIVQEIYITGELPE